MKSLTALFLGLSLVAALGLTAVAAAKDDAKKDKETPKEVTLKGTLTCAKCDLGKSDECATVIKVTEKVDGKDVDTIYWLKDTGNKEKYHGTICQKAKKGSVTGTVAEKDNKKWITPSKDGVKFE